MTSTTSTTSRPATEPEAYSTAKDYAAALAPEMERAVRAPARRARRRAEPAEERVVIYCRISEDPRKKEEGVERQRKDGLALAAARGWEVAGVYIDNDISAFHGKQTQRVEYERMMAAVRGGEANRIVAYGLSRLWRNRRERVEALERLRHLRGFTAIHLIRGGDIDLTSAAGRTFAGVMGEVDTMESEVKGERVAAAALDRAERGKANAHVAYGWRRVYNRAPNGEVLSWHDEEDPERAAIVREIVDRILIDGDSLKAITADLNARGVPPPRAALRALGGREAGEPYTPQKWGHSTVRKLALRSANIARVSRGEYDFEIEEGEYAPRRRRVAVHDLGPAAWPAIVDEDKHHRVVALLTDPTRATSRSGARKHLLSYGIGRCGICGGPLRVKVYSGSARRGNKHAYQCEAKGCTARNQGMVDLLVEEFVLARLQRSDAASLFASNDAEEVAEARERCAALRAKLERVQDDYDADLINREMFVRSVRRFRAELEEAEQATARHVQGIDPAQARKLAGPQAVEEWAGMSIPQRQALLQAMGCVVTLLKTKPGPGFNPESVRIGFGGEPLDATA